MFQELRSGIGQRIYEPVESDLEKYELEDEPDELVARQPRQEEEEPRCHQLV